MANHKSIDNLSALNQDHLALLTKCCPTPSDSHIGEAKAEMGILQYRVRQTAFYDIKETDLTASKNSSALLTKNKNPTQPIDLGGNHSFQTQTLSNKQH